MKWFTRLSTFVVGKIFMIATIIAAIAMLVPQLILAFGFWIAVFLGVGTLYYVLLGFRYALKIVWDIINIVFSKQDSR